MIVKSKVQTDKNYSQTTMKLRSNTHGCELIIMHLKQQHMQTPILYLYDPDLPLKLACDASSYGVGDVAIIEGVAIIFGLKKFHQYLLYRSHFTQPTIKPCRCGIYLVLQPAPIPTLAAARLVHWSVMLNTYEYIIEFKRTKEHSNLYMVSRLPPISINAMQIYFFG